MARLAGLEPATPGLEGRCSIRLSYKRKLVGVEGFEPPTSCSQSRRATKLRYTPTIFLTNGLLNFSTTLEELTMIAMRLLVVNSFFINFIVIFQTKHKSLKSCHFVPRPNRSRASFDTRNCRLQLGLNDLINRFRGSIRALHDLLQFRQLRLGEVSVLKPPGVDIHIQRCAF